MMASAMTAVVLQMQAGETGPIYDKHQGGTVPSRLKKLE